MVISHRKKYCFIAVPKTATSSITDLLLRDEGAVRNPSFELGHDCIKTLEHVSVSEMIKLIGESAWNNYFTFAFVRNPWSRAVSTYHYYRRGRAARGLVRLKRGMLKRPRGVANVILANTLDFKTWVRIHPGKPCLDYLTLNSGEIGVNWVMKFEELADTYPVLCDKLDLPNIPLTWENRSDHRPYTSYYDEATKEFVAKRYKKDIEAFDYTFGS
jgi:hypothetical protein